MKVNPTIAELEEQKEKKSYLPKNPLIIIIIFGILAFFIYNYVTSEILGVIIVIVAVIILFFLKSSEDTKPIPLSIKQVRVLLFDELNDLAGASRKYKTDFPQNINPEDIKIGNYDRLVDSLTLQILEFWYGFSIYKKFIRYYYIAKFDYWADGNGMIGIEYLGDSDEDEFKSIPRVRIKLVPTADYKDMKKYYESSQ